MPEVAKCPLCGKKPFPYHYYEGDHIEYVHCGVKCEDEETWNRYAAAMESQAKLDELRERVAWLLECEDYLLFLNPTNRWRSMFAYPELRHIVNAASKAVEELL